MKKNYKKGYRKISVFTLKYLIGSFVEFLASKS